jgi:predicted permease
MHQSQIVFLKIAVMFMVMVVGWWASRRDYVTPALTKALGILVVQLTFPCLIIVQMIGTVNPAALSRGWWIPLFALVSIVLAAWAGRLGGAFFGLNPVSRRTFTFLVAIPNWVFLPLPIVEDLYGADGVRFVLLYNFGAQFVLWSFGIRLLQGGKLGLSVWRTLLGNVGIWATLGGAAVALFFPGAARLGHSQSSSGLWIFGDGVMGTLKMIGDLTIPLSLLATGAQLGAMVKTSDFQWRPLAGVTTARLLVAPVLAIFFLKGAMMVTGASLTEAEFISAVVVVSMPVAISCALFAERFDGDGALSASSIFGSTLVSLVTVPGLVFISHWLI